jgi:predicted enzyme related to lactoylglutathione lyase
MNLNTARIFVRDLSEAKAFYVDVLGLPMTADGTSLGYCVFKPGAAMLVVESVSADAPLDEQVLVGRHTGLSFQVADVQSTYSDLLSRGVAFIEPPEEQAWGGILATLRDPAGNELQICQYPREA